VSTISDGGWLDWSPDGSRFLLETNDGIVTVSGGRRGEKPCARYDHPRLKTRHIHAHSRWIIPLGRLMEDGSRTRRQ
jgi:hypothetical protein